MTGINDLNNQNKQKPWYAVRTFNCQELKISDFLRERGKVHFIPMTYVEKEREGKMKRMLVPVVHNLIFLQKDESQKAMLGMLEECGVPFNVLRNKETRHLCEIPDSQMTEFRVLCDPDFKDTLYITHQEAEAKPGKKRPYHPRTVLRYNRQATPYPGRLLLHQDTCRRRGHDAHFPLVLRSNRITLPYIFQE